MTAGQTLKALRMKANKTQKDVAADCGITQSALAQYESDARMPRDSIKTVLADYYGKSVQSIFFAGNCNRLL